MATVLSSLRALLPITAQIGAGLLLSNASDWVVHTYVLHGLGSNRKSFWAFHWHKHHRNVRRNDHIDHDYEQPLWSHSFAELHSKAREAGALVAAGVLMAPLARWLPWFYGSVLYSGVYYYYVHRKSHIDPDWAREKLPWHYDHHMGPNQHANWCVTRPWFDHIMGTREPYLGTERATRDEARKAAQREKRNSSTDTATRTIEAQQPPPSIWRGRAHEGGMPTPLSQPVIPRTAPQT